MHAKQAVRDAIITAISAALPAVTVTRQTDIAHDVARSIEVLTDAVAAPETTIMGRSAIRINVLCELRIKSIAAGEVPADLLDDMEVAAYDAVETAATLSGCDINYVSSGQPEDETQSTPALQQDLTFTVDVRLSGSLGNPVLT